MASSPLNVVIRRSIADVGPDATDAELLARVVGGRDGDALAALVRRHAPMVWGVCGRLLHNHHDAEDAFQATFLVLARKAADVPRRAVGGWLHGVARQTAVRSRAAAAKRGRREGQVVNMVSSQESGVRSQAAEAELNELRFILDEELGRLPGHYRGVLVLCDLEGLTRKEAARQLGIPEGSAASRLARARALLAKRLVRRGVALAGGSTAAVSAGSASAFAPPALVASTIQATSLVAAGQATATGVISARVAALTEGVVRSMLATKIKKVSAVVLIVGLALGGIGVGVGLATKPAAARAEPPAPVAGEPPAPIAAAKPPHIVEKIDMKGRMPSGLPCNATEDGAVIVKSFFAKMPTYPDIRFREFFDPRYLKKHGLKGRDIAFEVVNHQGIDSLQVADDKQTVLVTLDLKGGGKEAFVMRCVVYEGHIYISPEKAPDPKTGIFTPWILRTKPAAVAARVSPPPAAPSDRERMVGNWFIMNEDSGRKGEMWVITEDSILMHAKETSPIVRHHAHRLDAGKDPKQIDITVTQVKGPLIGVIKGIYALDGDELRLCLGAIDKDRPAAFPEKPGPGEMLILQCNRNGTWPPKAKEQAPVQSDRERMVGNWHITNDDSGRKGEMWVIYDDSILMHANYLTPIVQHYAHRLDAGKDPKQIDITVTRIQGPLIGIIKGIYVLDGDELRLCLGAIDKDRPAAFPKKPGPGEVLILQRETFGRGKPKAKEQHPAQSDQERMVGEWVIASNDGKRNRKGEVWNISRDEIDMQGNLRGYKVILHFYRLDAAKNPKQIDITVTKTNKEYVGTIKGIYAFAEDAELRLCLGEMDKDRPTAFDRKPGEREFLILHRQKPGAEPPKAKVEPPAKTDQERMVGGWVIVSNDGNRSRKGENWIISKDQIDMNAYLDGLKVVWHYHRLDTAKNPKQIDITIKKSNGEVLGLIKGVYAIAGDDTELRLCLGFEGKDRPTTFAGKPGQSEFLILHRGLPGGEPQKAKEQPAKTDQERMVGGWIIVKSEGTRNRKGEVWSISKDQITMAANVGGFKVHWHYHRLDPSKNPKQIDIDVKKSNGEFIGLIKGIYAFADDDTELRLCLGEMGKDRPTAFVGKPGQSEFLILQGGDPAAWRRKKP